MHASSCLRLDPGPTRRLYHALPPAGWQSGYAEDCKSSYSGSIPLPASTPRAVEHANAQDDDLFGSTRVCVGDRGDVRRCCGGGGRIILPHGPRRLPAAPPRPEYRRRRPAPRLEIRPAEAGGCRTTAAAGRDPAANPAADPAAAEGHASGQSAQAGAGSARASLRRQSSVLGIARDRARLRSPACLSYMTPADRGRARQRALLLHRHAEPPMGRCPALEAGSDPR